MKLPHRRQFLHLAAGAAALPAMSRLAWAQAYPSRPVRLVVGFPAGGTNDIHARLIADWLSKQFGRSSIVENRPGAAGNIGLESVVRAAPDGYTLGVCGSTELRNEIIYNDLKFSFMHDTAPVASMMLAMNVLVVHPASSVRSVPELIAAAKANPDAMTVASAGVGSTSHVFWELFRSMTGTRMLHVPYRGGAPALTDLLAQQVQVYFATPADTMEYISVCDDARSSLRAYTAHEVGDRLADLIGAVFLDEMAPLHRHFGLVRPGAANFPLPADQDRAWVCINKELRNMGLGKPGRIVFNHLRNHARPCKRGPPVCPD